MRAQRVARAARLRGGGLGQPQHGADRRLLVLAVAATADLGFGRIVASEIEAPNMLVNLV